MWGGECIRGISFLAAGFLVVNSRRQENATFGDFENFLPLDYAFNEGWSWREMVWKQASPQGERKLGTMMAKWLLVWPLKIFCQPFPFCSSKLATCGWYGDQRGNSADWLGLGWEQWGRERSAEWKNVFRTSPPTFSPMDIVHRGPTPCNFTMSFIWFGDKDSK